MDGKPPPSDRREVARSSRSRPGAKLRTAGKLGSHPKREPFLDRMPRLSLDDVHAIYASITLQEPTVCPVSGEKSFHLDLPYDLGVRLVNTFQLLEEAVEPRDAFMKLHSRGKRYRGLEGARMMVIPYAVALVLHEHPGTKLAQAAQIVVDSELCTLGLSKPPTIAHVQRLYRKWIASAGKFSGSSTAVAFAVSLLQEVIAQLRDRYDK